MSWQVLEADCVAAMREMDEASIAAVVCDPPYGLEFMGKEWDVIGGRGGNPFDAGGEGLRKGSSERFANSPPLPTTGARKAMPKCAKCGKWQYNGWKPRQCTCENPEWVVSTSLAYPHRMQEWHQAWATEALRVLKPGGFLLAFGGTRTAHRLACAIEDAGFEIRDRILYLRGGDAVELGPELDWVYGSG